MIRRLKQYFNQSQHQSVLIHVGKCGGSSLRKAISESTKVSITGTVHIFKPAYIKNQHYYIVARDPIARCISAFNWRYKLVVEDKVQKHRFAKEFEVLDKYKVLNNLVENLYNLDGKLNLEVAKEFETIHHLRERHSYYLKSFLKKCPPSSIKGVFMQESLNDDIEKYLGVINLNKPVEKLNIRNKGNELSFLGKKNLVRYIEDDYHCLLKLNQLGLINRETMLNIFKNALSQ
tara:strand:+ start:9083 stop:9781 length:699 start_codon:yes stop_codon:yes gene_type:complete